MRFDKIIPCPELAPYVKYFVVSEAAEQQTYKVLPQAGLVLGFQYRGQLGLMGEQYATPLSAAGISGIADSFRIYRHSSDIGSILVYLTATGLTAFTATPAHELFNQSISLDHLFPRSDVQRVEEQLVLAATDRERIGIVEVFLLARLRQHTQDEMIQEAVQLILHTKGMVRMKALHQELYTSASPFEKRFRSAVGTTAKKYASIVRFNALLDQLQSGKGDKGFFHTYQFFDQAHFIKEFKHFTGETPAQFAR